MLLTLKMLGKKPTHHSRGIMHMTDEVFEPDAIDFYDWGELESYRKKEPGNT